MHGEENRNWFEAMKRIWMLADSIVSPLGSTTAENFSKVQEGISGLSLINHDTLGTHPFYGGFVSDLSSNESSSKFEVLCQRVMEQLMAKVSIRKDRTLFILSTTKGNISFLEEGRPDHPRIHLYETAAYLADKYGLRNHLVVSNACISGVMAMIVAGRLITAGQFDHAVVVGADVLSRFVVSGFESLKALSPDPCRPFDAQRKGINLGECAAGIVLGLHENANETSGVFISGGGLSNDANHISGPARTGEELAMAIRQALQEAGKEAADIDFISAHGTATLYNDEMEAKAFHIMNMAEKPINSMKGYFGHTLGAAGVLETILSAESLKHDRLIATAGFDQIGVSKPLNIIRQPANIKLRTCLKTASGFGGCNAAIVLQKVN
jgi:3-oxoacyl-[acyl-carrier-protein] synthase I